jgi:hypothetical protein
MRGAVNGGAGFGRLRRQVHFGVVDTDSTIEVQIITPPNVFFWKQRSCKSHISFFSLDVSYRKDFYGRAAHYYIENEGGVTTYNVFDVQVEPYVRQFRSVVVTSSAAIAAFSSKRRWFCLC